MAIHLHLEEIVAPFIKEDDGQDYLRRSLGEIEREIVNEIEAMIEKEEFEVDEIVKRAERLIERRARHTFMHDNWREIEHSLRKELERIA